VSPSESKKKAIPSEEPQRYLIAVSPPDQIVLITEVLKNDPEIEVLEVKGTDTPTIVVSTTPSRAEMLRKQFGGQLIIEKDQPLEMFGTDSLI
jgi:hypothetical protein